MEEQDSSRFVQLLGVYPDVHTSTGGSTGGVDIGAMDAFRKILIDFARVCRRTIASADFLTEAYNG
jgi:hypothetical protein